MVVTHTPGCKEGKRRKGVGQSELEESRYKIFSEAKSFLLSSTTSIGRIRGFTIELLFILKGRYLTTRDVSEKTGKKGNYVRPYLYNMKKYGLIEKEGSFWKLTDLGRELLEHYEGNNVIIESKRRVKEKKKKSKKGVKEALKKSKSSAVNKSDSFRISDFLIDLGLNLSKIEKTVVEVLIKHYRKTSSKFILAKDNYELADKLSCNSSDLPNALKNLRENGIIYIFKDKTFNCWKIGLKKQFLERLKTREPNVVDPK